MTSINHCLSIAAVKSFANGQLLKKVTAPTDLPQRQILVINGSGTQEKGKVFLTGNLI